MQKTAQTMDLDDAEEEEEEEHQTKTGVAMTEQAQQVRRNSIPEDRASRRT
jgi:hypothetical protein